MFTITLAEVSETAGNSSDGIVRGTVAQSLFNYVYDGVEPIERVYAFNLDISGGSIDFTDYTTEATSGVANSFLPWGTDGTFSDGDAVYLASSEDVTEIRLVIDTGAVWVGGGLEVWDSTDGLTPNRQLSVISDTTNGLRNTGTGVIKWTDPVAPRVAWSPVPGFITSRKWIVVKPSGYISSTVSPKASMTFMIGLGNDFEDETAVYNASMSDSSFGVVSDVVYFTGESTIFSLPYPGIGVDFMIHRKCQNVRDVVLEYYAVGGTWVTLPNLDDPSDWMKNGPASLLDPPELFHVRWSPPLDWQVLPLVIQPDGGGAPITITGAHMRARVTTVTDVAQQAPPLVRARARSLDAAGGVRCNAGGVYTSLTFEAGVPCLVDTKIQLLNINTGLTTTAIFPANTLSSCDLAANKVLFAQSLTINPSDSLLITWQSGGTLQNVELVLQ